MIELTYRGTDKRFKLNLDAVETIEPVDGGCFITLRRTNSVLTPYDDIETHYYPATIQVSETYDTIDILLSRADL